MGEEITGVSQYKLTNDIIKHCYTLDLKDSTFKVLTILSIHYPNILINRKSLIKRYHIPEKTVDRALKELVEKQIINRHFGGKITVNLTALYSQFDGEKVVNLTVTCSNQHDKTINTNTTCDMSSTEQNNEVVGLKNSFVDATPTGSEVKQQTNNVVVSLLKGFGFVNKEIEQLCTQHTNEELEKYSLYVENRKDAQNKKRYFLWCIQNKPFIEETQTNKQKQEKGLPVSNVEKYKKWLESKEINILNSRDYAHHIVFGTSDNDIERENQLRLLIEAILRWNIKVDEYGILLTIDSRAAKDKEFKQKCSKIAGEVLRDFKLAGVPVIVDNQQSKAS